MTISLFSGIMQLGEYKLKINLLSIAMAMLLTTQITNAATISVEKRGKGGSCMQEDVNIMGDVGNYVVSVPSGAVMLNSFEVKDGIFSPAKPDCTAGYCRLPPNAETMIFEYQVGATMCRIHVAGIEPKNPVATNDMLNAFTPAVESKNMNVMPSRAETPTHKPSSAATYAPKTVDNHVTDMATLRQDVGFSIMGNAKDKSKITRMSLEGNDHLFIVMTKGLEVVGGLDLNGKSRYLGMINGRHKFDMSAGQVKVTVSDTKNNRSTFFLVRDGEKPNQAAKPQTGMFKERYVLAPNKGTLKEQLSAWVASDAKGYRLLWSGPDKVISNGEMFSADLIESLVKFSEVTGYKVNVFELEKEIEIYTH